MPLYRNSENTVEFHYRSRVEPGSELELADFLKRFVDTGRRVKVSGGNHSFNHIKKTDDTLLDLSNIAEHIRWIGRALAPVLPQTSEEILKRYGTIITNGDALFPRRDT